VKPKWKSSWAATDWEQTLPQVVRIVDKVELETEKLVTHLFLLALILIVVGVHLVVGNGLL
jgi:hypothetical protein